MFKATEAYQWMKGLTGAEGIISITNERGLLVFVLADESSAVFKATEARERKRELNRLRA